MTRPTWAQLNADIAMTELARDAAAVLQHAATTEDMDTLAEMVEVALAMAALVRSSEEWIGRALRHGLEARDRLAPIAERSGVAL